MARKKIDNADCYLCADCVNVFYENDKVVDSIESANTQAPYKTTFQICNIASKYVKIFETNSNYQYGKLLSDILHEIDFKNAYAKTNFEGHESHKYYFIKTIVEEYVRIQLTYTAKRVTLKEQKLMLHNKLKKLIHFYNQ